MAPRAAPAPEAVEPGREGSSTSAESNADPTAPFLTADLQEVRRAAQGEVLGKAASPADPHLADALLETHAPLPGAPRAPGRFVPIENEAALAHFHGALEKLAAGEDDDGKVRILAYGASHTQADAYTGYLRAYLQRRFGNGGQGFVSLGRVNPWYRTLDTRVRHRHLKVRHATYRQEVENEPLGLFGAAFIGRTKMAFGEIQTSNVSESTRFEVHYYAEPGGGDFTLQVDDETIALVRTKARSPGAAYHSFETTSGRHRIRAQLRGNGPVRLFGVTAETTAPGVVVDTLGISGSKMASHLRWREDAWIDAVRRRRPDLVTFAYGTNETMDPPGSIELYEQQLTNVVARLRSAVPEASCVFIAPFDLPKAKRSRLLTIIDAQRRISQEFNCGFWDGYAFMGGAGSMRRWVKAKPPLASTDYVHLTNRGYVYAGLALGDALMRGYDHDVGQGEGSGTLATSSSSP
jgi:lysophospholipase L1-like esterase